jgi:hypothetical protein
MRVDLIAILIVISTAASAQTFNETTDFNSDVQGYHSIIEFENNLYISGWSDNSGESENILVSSFKNTGESRWFEFEGNPNYNHVGNVILGVGESEILVIGNQNQDPIDNPNYYDILVVLMDTSGETIAEYSYGGYDKSEAIWSAINSNDTIYITGFYYDLALDGNTEALLWSFSPTGDSLSLHTYGHPDYDFIGNKIIRAQNGDFLIAGFARDGFDEDRLLMRIAPNGELLWYEIYEGVDMAGGTTDYFRSLIELEDGNILCAGIYSLLGDYEANLVKLSSTGEVIWDELYGNIGTETFEEISLRNDTLFAAGTTSSNITSGKFDAWVMALDTAGNTLWSHTYNPDGIPDNEANDYLYDFTLTSDGGMAFCGWSSRETQDAWIMKLDGNGLCDTASCFPDLVGITPQVLTGMPTPRIFPNPASDYLTIQNSVGDALTWTVYNQYGQTVLQVNTNGQQVIMDCRQLPAGVYVIQANSDRGIRFSDKLIKR